MRIPQPLLYPRCNPLFFLSLRPSGQVAALALSFLSEPAWTQTMAWEAFRVLMLSDVSTWPGRAERPILVRSCPNFKAATELNAYFTLMKHRKPVCHPLCPCSNCKTRNGLKRMRKYNTKEKELHARWHRRRRHVRPRGREDHGFSGGGGKSRSGSVANRSASSALPFRDRTFSRRLSGRRAKTASVSAKVQIIALSGPTARAGFFR